MGANDEWAVRDTRSLGRAISQRRKLEGLSQEDLADAAGIHRSYLSDIERGKNTDHTDRLFRVLRRLGLEVVVRPRSLG